MDDAASPRPAGRPLDPEVERAILTATQDLLIEHGYRGMTIAGIAARAHCSKSAVYRRWETKPELVIAAVRSRSTPPEVPDTGSLRGDLLACALHYTQIEGRAGLLLASLFAEFARTPELRDASYQALGRQPIDALRAVVARWLDRGAVSPHPNHELVLRTLTAFAFQSVVSTGSSPSAAEITTIVDDVLMPALTAPRRP